MPMRACVAACSPKKVLSPEGFWVDSIERPVGVHPSPPDRPTIARATQHMLHEQSSGRAISDDGALALVLRAPTVLGGHGAGTNAEQLLAAGLAAGFHGALMLAALSKGMQLAGKVGIVAKVHLDRKSVV